MERNRERILTKSEVMEIISRLVENPTISRELSDTQGLYLLEAEINDPEKDQTIEYQYMRKGIHGKNQARETGICMTSYIKGIPEHSEMILVYNSKNNEWKDVR